MLLEKIIQLIQVILDIFEDWACPTNCTRSICYCRNTNPVSKWLCYKL